MEYNSKEVIPQEETMVGASKQSKLCVGYDKVVLPNNTVTGVTIKVTQSIKPSNLTRAQMVIKTLDTR